ncbi:hypothetical protein [Tolypothrix sp. NIES-4075]|uniref:hypothetical protein n=1 Tax=Tolypothrix sp. NIES-4075 TaxID=2005459 RepID=UPI00135C05A5|nr:hypothetical protein [Tolypothrix sp. NIES-4075]
MLTFDNFLTTIAIAPTFVKKICSSLVFPDRSLNLKVSKAERASNKSKITTQQVSAS